MSKNSRLEISSLPRGFEAKAMVELKWGALTRRPVSGKVWRGGKERSGEEDQLVDEFEDD